MTIRRTAPATDTVAIQRALLVNRARSAYSEADDAEAGRVVRRVLPDGTVMVGIAEAPAVAASVAVSAPVVPSDVAARVAALRARLNGGAFRPVGE